ncbi:hypothetical protein ACKWTF_014766 [Chironomus riparius]
MKSILAFSLLIAAATAYGHGSSYVSRDDHNIPTGYHHHVDEHHDSKDYYHHPSYKFEYGVNDPHTHDHKSQWEHRDGDVVKGEYTLDEADGTKRVVKYHADDKTGFTAHVERIGHASHEHSYGHHY